MTTQPGRPTPTVPTPEQSARLREAFLAADFTVEGVGALLGPAAGAALHRDEALPARRVVAAARRDGDAPAAALATLVDLFTLGGSVAEVGRAATPGLDVAVLAELAGLGVLAVAADGTVRATCDLRPYGEEERCWWVASDVGEPRRRGPLPTDHVVGIGSASLTLASWTPRPAVPRLLDVGTGCGVQALHGAGHARRVVATDVSARALAYAAFNAALAGQRWDLRRGDLFAPVAGEEFDLVVSNPPFVVSPRAGGLPRYDYRDGGRVGDALVEEFVRGVGAHLAPGGIATFLGNWETTPGLAWQDRWAAWLDGNDLDAWVVEREHADPCEYAQTWARDGGHRPGTPVHDRLVGAWLDDFSARGIERIGFGVVTLQRPRTARAPWRDLAAVATPVAAPMGPTILAGLAARTWLADHDDAAILSARWRCSPDVTLEQHGRPGAPDPTLILARQGGGLRRVVRLDTPAAALLGVCDGELPAGSALSAIAGLLEEDTDAVVAHTLPTLRALIADGLVSLAPPAGTSPAAAEEEAG